MNAIVQKSPAAVCTVLGLALGALVLGTLPPRAAEATQSLGTQIDHAAPRPSPEPAPPRPDPIPKPQPGPNPPPPPPPDSSTR